jgi:hypothetical protein
VSAESYRIATVKVVARKRLLETLQDSYDVSAESYRIATVKAVARKRLLETLQAKEDLTCSNV